MTRELKFRLWDYEKKTMVYADSLQHLSLIVKESGKPFNQFVIQQFSGKYDIYDFPIYDGDIFEIWILSDTPKYYMFKCPDRDGNTPAEEHTKMALIIEEYCKACDCVRSFVNHVCPQCEERKRRTEMAAWQALTSDEKLLDIHRRLLKIENNKEIRY